MMRLFVAFHVEEAIRRELSAVQDRLRASGADVRWSAPTHFHLTVKFLGDIEDERLPDVEDACAWVAEQAAPFRFALRGVSTFPKRGPEIKVLWAGVTEGTAEWAALATKADEAFAPFGVAREGGLVPHVTLGRVRGSANLDALREAIRDEAGTDFGARDAGDLILIRSVLDPGGATYEDLRRWPLGGAGGAGDSNE
jgi:RNA 2',3'-cyclic 3'-phosphodiesterase